MADITVADLEEFRAALTSATSSDVIICPEGAEWDWNELGLEDPVRLKTDAHHISGNDTTIKNFYGNIRFADKYYSTRIHFLNAVCNTDPFINSSAFTECKFSVQLGVNVVCFSRAAYLKRCSINADFQGTKCCISSSNYGTGVAAHQYLRIHINAPNAIHAPAYGSDLPAYDWNTYNNNCEWIIDAPQAIACNMAQMTNCTVRGNMPSITSPIQGDQGKRNAILLDSMPNADLSGLTAEQQKWYVTDAQMRDINFLHNLGFEIG